MPKKLTYEFVKGMFEEGGCELVSTEYVNDDTRLQYMCSCGNLEIQKITYASFRKGRRCKKCGTERRASLRRHSYAFIQSEFEKAGCKLLSSEYMNKDTILKYMCSCGNSEVQKITYGAFRIGHRCKKCGIEKIASSRRLSYDYVKSEFEKAGCKLLSTEYINNRQYLKYYCSCGNPKIQKIVYSAFQKGHRCNKCGIEKRQGENSHNWSYTLTQEERETGRNYPEYKQWIKDIYKRDHYACQKCGSKKSGNLNAHHIAGYTQNKDLRIELSNGVTLCKDCHKEFHKKYSYTKSTPADFQEFMQEKKVPN